MTARYLAAGLVWMFVLPVGSAAAQDSRAARIAAAQDEKAARLRPAGPSKAEAVFLRLLESYANPTGPFPYFDSVYSGGGFTLGAGYRRFFGDNTAWDVKGLYSFSNYKKIELGITSRDHLAGRLHASVYGGWRDATQVAYYGLGIDTVPADRANFRLKLGYLSGLVDFHPVPWAVLAGGLALEDYTLTSGQGSVRSIEDAYTPATAPGLDADPTYLHTQGTAGIDWRTAPGYTRRGGYYGVTLHDYADLDDTYSFNQLDVNLIQHLPILRENWVVSLRGRLQTLIGDDDQAPLFLLPSLGSGSTLRAYSSWRFRDRHSMLFSAEWRWIPNRLGLDMALFYDAGQVAPTRNGLSIDRLKTNWGVGARFHTLRVTPLRIEFAHGDEGWHLVFAGDAAF
jgi:Omp85 superfamily domain